jgi:hypothetical protein
MRGSSSKLELALHVLGAVTLVIDDATAPEEFGSGPCLFGAFVQSRG